MRKIETNIPLLIPSFSSKGNIFLKKDDGTLVSDNLELLEALDIRLSATYLISAYDAYYGFISANPDDWPETDYLFVDSGGYEISNSFDSNERNKFNFNVHPWNEDRMLEVYRKVYCSDRFRNTARVFSCFDCYASFEDQLSSAIKLSKEFPDAVVNFLIKQAFDFNHFLDEIRSHSQELSQFEIIGITEKELGETVQNRLVKLAKLKETLNSLDWGGKIHVFGGLDPYISILYYIAGADIFDGLSWQRIRYPLGTGLLDKNNYNISCNDYENKYDMMIDNLAFLNKQAIFLACELDNREEKRHRLLDAVKKSNLTIGELFRCLEV